MSIGDVRSTERGSGARFNDGKPALELVPLRLIAESWLRAVRNAPDHHTPEQRGAMAALFFLADFQEGGDERALYSAIEALGSPWHDCAAVFDYGRQKYAAWNWAKGMAWSVPIACAARHLEALFAGEPLDPPEKGGSGLHHRGHVVCNLVMLLTYLRTYPEGDDRPTLLAPQCARGPKLAA